MGYRETMFIWEQEVSGGNKEDAVFQISQHDRKLRLAASEIWGCFRKRLMLIISTFLGSL